MSFSKVPIWPSSVVPITDIFQVVMLSASLNLSCARPCLSVSSDGCQTSVSGKYSRRRGVNDCALPDLVTMLTPLSAEMDLTLNTSPRVALVVCTAGASAVTVTVSLAAPSRNSTLTSTMFDARTRTFVITVATKPCASNLSSYNPGARLPNRNFPSSLLVVEKICESDDLVAVIVTPPMTAPLGSTTEPEIAPLSPENMTGEFTAAGLASGAA